MEEEGAEEPPVVVTMMFPVTAAAGTAAVSEVSLLTVLVVAGTPPKETFSNPFEKPDPVTVTAVPKGPEVGEMVVMVGVDVLAVDPVTSNWKVNGVAPYAA
jgi:hypothetical protein